MKIVFFLFFCTYIFAKSTFITPKEYAAQLYKNPRGIGCQHCHGERGEGRLIANYRHKGKQKSFSGPPIDNISFQNFYIALNERKKGMPRYFLTDSEIEALYLNLHKNDIKKAKQGIKDAR